MTEFIETPTRANPQTSFPEMVWIPGGTFQMGSDKHYPDEAPAHRVAVNGFWIDRTPVTNERFRRFVEATGHRTFAEIPPNPIDYPGAIPEMLHPGSLVFIKPGGPVDMRDISQWWRFVLGADWQHPLGPNSTIGGKKTHPVVHVAYSDAEAFAHWEGKVLPTEAEWEYACRGGLEGATYAWGEDYAPGNQIMTNHWQGLFPWENLAIDGFEGTSPVGTFPPNGYGLYDMIGNVWEWTSDWYKTRHSDDTKGTCCAPRNPRSDLEEASFDPAQPEVRIPRKVLKGGSHLCSFNYCYRFRPAARFPEPIDTSTCHVGFRCIVRASNTNVSLNGGSYS